MKMVLTKLELSFLEALIRLGDLLPLLVKRDGSLQIVKATEIWQLGDEIYCLLHDPRPKLLKRLSGDNQSSRLALEKLPKVEEIKISSLKTGKDSASISKTISPQE